MHQHMERAIRLITGNVRIIADDSKRLIGARLRALTGQPGIRKILELPCLGGRSLGRRGALKERDIISCTAIGLAGWTAWTAIDRVRDGENRSQEEDAADIYAFSALRPVIDDLVRGLSLPAACANRISRIIGTMEYANAPQCALGARDRSSWKSMGAAMPLMALMMKAGASDADVGACEGFFHRFILARQLSDDALDWREDTGQSRSAKAIGGTPVTELLGRYFDREGKYEIAMEIRTEARRAIQEACGIECFEDTRFLEGPASHYAEMAEAIIARRPARPSRPCGICNNRSLPRVSAEHRSQDRP